MTSQEHLGVLVSTIRCLLVLLLRVDVYGLIHLHKNTRNPPVSDSNDGTKHRKRIFRKPMIPIGRKEYFALLQC